MTPMKKGVIIFWSIFVGWALIRVLISLHYSAPDIGDCKVQQIMGVGTVSEEPSRTEAGQVLVVSAQKIHTQESSTSTETSHTFSECRADISIRMKTKLYPRFVFGDQILFTGKLNTPFNFSSGTGRSFDYRGYLAKDDVFYEIKSAHVSLCDSKCIDSLFKNSDTQSAVGFIQKISDAISSILFSLRRGFVAHLNSTLGEPHAALAAGLVVGEKSALGKDLLDDFRTVGLIHIVVLSGYNITVVGDALRRLLSFLPRMWGIVIGGIGIALFGVLVGGGATVVRSCVMAAIALFAQAIRRDYDVPRALGFAALIMLIQSPMILVHDPSFQLSFLATLGLILLATPVESKLGFITDKYGIRGIVAATIATQIFVSPYILYMMGQISLIGMFVNIIVLPFIPVTMLAVFLTGAIGFISTSLSYYFGWVAHLLLSYELFIVQHSARFPFASLHIGVFSGWWTVLFYILFFVVYGVVKAGVFRKKDPTDQKIYGK